MTYPLGRTGIAISPIGLGCWQFSEGKGIVGGYWAALSDDVVREVVKVSLAAGVNWFDTAEAYGGGASERALARALKALGKKDGDVIVATKWLPAFRTARSITDTIDERLRCLDGFSIDLHQIHQPWGALATHAAQMQALAELVKNKKIRSAGISNFSTEAMRRCHALIAGHGVPLASNQVDYSLLNRKIESRGLIAAAKELGVTIIAYSPLAQGMLTGRFHEDPSLLEKTTFARRIGTRLRRNLALERTRPVIDALRSIAAEVGGSPAQVALAWTVQFHGDTVVAIPGASSAKQAEQNAAAMKLALRPEHLRRLDEASRPFL